MADIEIAYSGNTIATINNSGITKLLTEGKYCQDDIEITYTKPSGSGPFTLLDTFTSTIDARDFTMPWSTDWETNNQIIIGYMDFTLTDSDWLYYQWDGSSPSGGVYGTQIVYHKKLAFVAYRLYKVSPSWRYFYVTKEPQSPAITSAPTNLYIYTYKRSTLIKAGASMSVYGYPI